MSCEVDVERYGGCDVGQDKPFSPTLPQLVRSEIGVSGVPKEEVTAKKPKICRCQRVCLTLRGRECTQVRLSLRPTQWKRSVECRRFALGRCYSDAITSFNRSSVLRWISQKSSPGQVLEILRQMLSGPSPAFGYPSTSASFADALFVR